MRLYGFDVETVLTLCKPHRNGVLDGFFELWSRKAGSETAVGGEDFRAVGEKRVGGRDVIETESGRISVRGMVQDSGLMTVRIVETGHGRDKFRLGVVARSPGFRVGVAAVPGEESRQDCSCSLRYGYGGGGSLKRDVVGVEGVPRHGTSTFGGRVEPSGHFRSGVVGSWEHSGAGPRRESDRELRRGWVMLVS